MLLQEKEKFESENQSGDGAMGLTGDGEMCWDAQTLADE